MTKKDFESLGENAVKAKEYGAELVLGEDYLSKLDGDIISAVLAHRFTDLNLLH